MAQNVTVQGQGALPPLSACIELLKPITWFPPMWAFGCGIASVASSGHSWTLFVAGVLLCGPLVCGTSQAVNDWFDRDVDAINQPERPIPSGRVPGRWGLWISIAWTALSLVVSTMLGYVGIFATAFGLLLAWLYSAPPVRLKCNGWWGNAAVGLCYEGLPWVTGAAVMSTAIPSAAVFLLAALYSVGAHGIMTLNDFKSVDGDRRMGIGSLPVRLGPEKAALVACHVMAWPQLLVVALLLHWHRPFFAVTITLLLMMQVMLMHRLLRKPRELAPWYNATGISLYVAGMLICAFAVRGV